MIKVSPIKLNLCAKNISKSNVRYNQPFKNDVINSQFATLSSEGYKSYLPNMILVNSPSFTGGADSKSIDRNKVLRFGDVKTEFGGFSEEYRTTVKEAYKALGKENIAFICHGASLPAEKSADTGYGTCNSEGTQNLMNFLDGFFTAIQLGPQGMTSPADASPYASTSFSLNILTIDLESLTEGEWGNILSQEKYNEIIESNSGNAPEHANYKGAIKNYKEALDEAWENFKKLDDPTLQEKFETFKDENKDWLDSDALYEAFVEEHNGQDDWHKWDDELDKNLFDDKTEEDARKNRIADIEDKYGDLIERYKFVQFVASEQILKTKHTAKMKMIADRQVAFSNRDVWANKSLFMGDWKMGCPPDYFSKKGQDWNFDVLDPEKIFDKNGELLEGGKLLHRMFYKIFRENQGGVRIDHIIGLIDPWWYKDGHLPNEHTKGYAGRLHSTPKSLNPELGKYYYINDGNCPDNFSSEDLAKTRFTKNGLSEEEIDRYAQIITKIIIPAAKEAGLSKDEIIAEDLGILTEPVKAVMEKVGLNGIRVVQFVNPDDTDDTNRCKNIGENCWVAAGTHDNVPIWVWAEEMKNEENEGVRRKHAENLCEDLYSGFDNKEEIKNELMTNNEFLAMSKLVELFACKAKNVQISFMDVFGYKEPYNTPGDNSDKNWNLRVTSDFEELYKDSFAQKTALNLPFILSCAIRARGEEFIKQNKDLLERLDALAFEN